jgi:hypothetical protein
VDEGGCWAGRRVRGGVRRRVGIAGRVQEWRVLGEKTAGAERRCCRSGEDGAKPVQLDKDSWEGKRDTCGRKRRHSIGRTLLTPSQSSGVEVNVISHKRQRYAVWYGGSLMASTVSPSDSCASAPSTLTLPSTRSWSRSRGGGDRHICNKRTSLTLPSPRSLNSTMSPTAGSTMRNTGPRSSAGSRCLGVRCRRARRV